MWLNSARTFPLRWRPCAATMTRGSADRTATEHDSSLSLFAYRPCRRTGTDAVPGPSARLPPGAARWLQLRDQYLCARRGAVRRLCHIAPGDRGDRHAGTRHHRTQGVTALLEEAVEAPWAESRGGAGLRGRLDSHGSLRGSGIGDRSRARFELAG